MDAADPQNSELSAFQKLLAAEFIRSALASQSAEPPQRVALSTQSLKRPLSTDTTTQSPVSLRTPVNGHYIEEDTIRIPSSDSLKPERTSSPSKAKKGSSARLALEKAHLGRPAIPNKLTKVTKIPSKPSLTMDIPRGFSHTGAVTRPIPSSPKAKSTTPNQSRPMTKAEMRQKVSSLTKAATTKASQKNLSAKKSARAEPGFNPNGPASKQSEDVVMTHVEKSAPPSRPKRFIIGLDYGTTFTSVSYYACAEDEEVIRAFPSDIKSICNWPQDGCAGDRRQVPTESWYPPTPRVRDLQTDPDISDDEGDSETEGNGNGEPSSQASNWSRVGPPSQMTSDQQFLDSNLDDDSSETYIWGYDVPYQRFRANSTRNLDRHMERPKLLLVTSNHTEEDRTKLRPRLERLIKSRIIKKYGRLVRAGVQDVRDVVADFLTRIFLHTKQQLMEIEGLTDQSQVEFVLTVPAIWSPGSSRVMQFAMEAAMRATGLGSLTNGCINNLFVPTEPEAAATYLIETSSNLLAGETFVMLDCGGGTVDAVTYTVSNSYPLRLHNEVGLPTGDNCGASYLNDNFEKRLLERLADEDYLDQFGDTRETLVKNLVPIFEDYEKRNKDIFKRPSSRMKIPGLRGDQRQGLTGAATKRFEDNFILLDSTDYNAIFLPLLHRVGKVLQTQLNLGLKSGKTIRKVFLIGGFGAAPSLRSFLRSFVVDVGRELKLHDEIELITTSTQESVTAIASGSVLRALNKQGGPTRKAYSSYGFLRKEHYQPDVYEGHRAAVPEVDELDGEEYVTIIDYFMVKNTVIRPVHRFKPFKSYHAFDLYNEELRCEEVVYVSDFATRSQFQPDHYENRDAQVAGRIITTMKFLRHDGNIQMPKPDEDGNVKGKPHYLVEYDLIPIVEGRNLRYETKYAGEVLKTGQVSIASAFQPGTG